MSHPQNSDSQTHQSPSSTLSPYIVLPPPLPHHRLSRIISLPFSRSNVVYRFSDDKWTHRLATRHVSPTRENRKTYFPPLGPSPPVAQRTFSFLSYFFFSIEANLEISLDPTYDAPYIRTEILVGTVSSILISSPVDYLLE